MPDNGLVLILDDEERVRHSLAELLAEHGYQTQLWAEPEELFSAGEPSVPGCLLLDNHLDHRLTGIAVHKELVARGWTLPVIFLTGRWNLDDVKQALRRGADDFLSKPPDPKELLAAVAKALRHSGTQFKQRANGRDLQQRVASLTPREREVAIQVLNGKLNKQIAGDLDIALVTVKVHRSRAMAKLKADNLADLARIARAAGLVN